MVSSNKQKKFERYKLKHSTAKQIEAHEVFLDAEVTNLPETEENFKLESPIKKQIFVRLFIFSVFCLSILILGAFYLQIINYDYYLTKSEKNSSRVYQVPALRGIIYDSSGQQLVFNEPSFDLVASLEELPTGEKLDNLIKEISLLFPDVGDMNSKIETLRKSNRSFVLLTNIPRNQALIIEARGLEFPGFRIQQSAIRRYDEKTLLSHIIGYLGKMTESEIKKNPEYAATEYIGKSGLELNYEKILRGEPGTLEVEVDSLGRSKKETLIFAPKNGNNLVLSVDLNLEKKLREELKSVLLKIGISRAAALVTDSATGDILAMVSLPEYDANLFAGGISSADYKKLTEDANKPMFNRVIAGLYPSGSIIKPLLASAALEEKIITPQKNILSTGGIVIKNQFNNETGYTFDDWKAGGHGLVNMTKAIAESVNTYFYTIGGGYGDVKGLGIDRIKKYLELFGWGNLLGVDLPGEKEGLIPDANWKKNIKNERWYIGDTYNTSIGQGDIAVTPLQVAAAVGAVANGGILYKPKFVKRIVDEKNNIIEEMHPEVIRGNFILAENLAVVRKGMREAVVSGSSRALADLPVKAAGKTGTAQFGAGKTHAWFSGFAPYEKPEIIITVLIEGGGEGSSVAVPVAKEVLKWYFNNKNK